MPTTKEACRACGALLETGALRCRRCGARRGEERGASVSFALEDFLAPWHHQVLELVAELENLSPEAAAWLLRPERPRPPRPIMDARAAALLDEIAALVAANPPPRSG